jgi:hypothetical protein
LVEDFEQISPGLWRRVECRASVVDEDVRHASGHEQGPCHGRVGTPRAFAKPNGHVVRRR